MLACEFVMPRAAGGNFFVLFTQIAVKQYVCCQSIFDEIAMRIKSLYICRAAALSMSFSDQVGQLKV